MARRKPLAGLPEQFVDFVFPASGVDLTAEFELQRQGTTPTGENVRTYENLTQRGRGGSRPGLTKYLPAIVGGGSVLQHLNYIVDPQADALLAAFDPLDTPVVPFGIGWGFGPGPFVDYGFPTLQLPTPQPFGAGQEIGAPGGGGILDPSTENPGGRFVRTGGSGVQLNRNVWTRHRQPQQKIRFVQSATIGFALGAGTHTLAFPSDVGSSNLLIAVVCSEGGGDTFAISDTLGNTWHNLGQAANTDPSFTNYFFDVYYAVSNGAGADGVSYDFSNPSAPRAMAILEYTGTAASPLDDANRTSNAPQGAAATSGTVNVSGEGELLLGVFSQGSTGGVALTPTGGSILRCDQYQTGGFFANAAIYVTELIGTDVPLAATANFATPQYWCALAASFKPA